MELNEKTIEEMVVRMKDMAMVPDHYEVHPEVIPYLFIGSFGAVQGAAYDNSAAHGFHDDQYHENPAEKIALMHSELSEMLEAVRKESGMSEKIPAFTHEAEELADLVIRAMDYAGTFGIPLAEAILAKHEYNVSRPYKHGKKF